MLTGGPARAQVPGGALVGSVVDQIGQPIPHAVVRVEDALHDLSRSVASDGAGFFRVGDLPPASYAVTAIADGFKTVTRGDVPVTVDSTTHVDIRMPLASLTEAVTVTAKVWSLQTMSGDLGTVLDRARIQSLPLNRRDFLQLSLLTPGVEGPVDNSELSSRGGFSMHANGAREEFNNFLLDGVDNNDPYVNRYVVQPSVDSVEEFKVATNSYSADHGRNAGGQVNVVTRRGTSRFGGSAYEYFRNRGLNARNYFETAEQQPFTRNQFGVNIGGPLVRVGTLFFASLDVLRDREGLSRLATVPTNAERRGDLSALARTIVDPFTGMLFAGNIIPTQRISPIARQILSMFPVTSRTDPANVLGQPTQRDDHIQSTVRVDHRIGADDTLTVRYSGGMANAFEPFTEGTGVTGGFGDFVTDRTWNAMAEYRAVVSARVTNSLRFGANGFSRDLLTENHTTDVGAAWGVSWLTVPSESFGYPIIDVAGYSRVGDAFSLPILRSTATYQVIDDLTLERGAHLLKLGGEARHVALDSKVDLFSRGQLSFTGAFTGSGIGDLLLGLPTFGIKAQADNPIHMRTNAWAAYLQDDWRVRPNLTLNLGVRYEYMSPPVDAYDAMSIFDATTKRLVQAGTNGVSRSGISPDRNNVAPRLGVSWAPARRTVVRGGYGLFYDSGMLTVNTAHYFNPPYFNLRVFVPGPSGLTLENPFALNSGFVPPPTLSSLSNSVTDGYLQHWNTAVQQELGAAGTVTIAYAGSKGSHLIRPRNLNQAVPGPGDIQARRPNPQYSDIFFIESEGRSRFDSLQITFDRPLSSRVSLLAVYTLAESNDDASAFLGTPADKNLPQDSRNPGAEWGFSSYDVRHRLAVAYIVQLPSTSPWTRNTQVQGITTIHTGQPFTPIMRFDNSNTGNSGGSTAGSDRPNVVGNPELSDPTVERWFRTDAFVVPPAYSFGNAGRNSLRGPGFASFDVAISRQFRSGGHRASTVGIQVFNLFNRANFDLPEHFVDEPATFGRIASAKAPRQVQLAARFEF